MLFRSNPPESRRLVTARHVSKTLFAVGEHPTRWRVATTCRIGIVGRHRPPSLARSFPSRARRRRRSSTLAIRAAPRLTWRRFWPPSLRSTPRRRACRCTSASASRASIASVARRARRAPTSPRPPRPTLSWRAPLPPPWHAPYVVRTALQEARRRKPIRILGKDASGLRQKSLSAEGWNFLK